MSQQMSLEEYKQAIAEEEKKQFGHLGQSSVVTSEWDWLWHLYLDDTLTPAEAPTVWRMGY